jgi:hypothetical protein
MEKPNFVNFNLGRKCDTQGTVYKFIIFQGFFWFNFPFSMHILLCKCQCARCIFNVQQNADFMSIPKSVPFTNEVYWLARYTFFICIAEKLSSIWNKKDRKKMYANNIKFEIYCVSPKLFPVFPNNKRHK